MTWILPRNLRTSAFATATEESTSDLTLQQVEESGLSLFARSKPLRLKMLLRKWKQGELRRLRSGLILKPSLGKAFEERWTSSLEASLANHSAQQASGSEPKTPAISGLTSQMEFLFCAPQSASLRTSKDTFRWDSPQSSAIWKQWVTQCRGAYSQRLKSAHLTNEKGCLSWPTAKARDWKDTLNCSLDAVNPDGTHRNRRDRLVGAVAAVQDGLPDPASRSTNGRNQGSCDPCDILDPFGESLLQGAASQWPTASVCGNHNRKGASANSGDGLSTAVKNWATPRAGKTTDEDIEVWAKRKANGDVATMPLGAQVKNWSTPQASDPEHAGPNQRDSSGRPAQVMNWGTPCTSMAQDKQEDSGKHKLGEQEQNNSGKKLNPRWVCQLMGVPTDWVYPSESERNRTDELRMLGNGVVPQTAAKAFTELLNAISNL